ncbi:MAG: hypothetical protein KUG77_17550 [Nannocystaceae bacterium]|nr:hypothetical protein [Nannocystaceae bacterium]
MVSPLRLRSPAALCLFSAALATASLTGCDSGGGDDDASGSSSDASSTTDDASTTAVASTGSATADPSSSSTTDPGTSGSSTAAESSSSTTTDEGSSSTGEGCDPGTANCSCDGDACEGELVCTDGTCFNPAGCQGKQQDTEPNETEGAAQGLGSVNCGELAEVSGSSEVDDVDFYTVDLVDLGEDCPNSDGTISIVTAEEDLEVCMFFACDAGAVSVNCGADSDATSEDGLAGCCGTNSVEPDFFCSGVTNASEVRLRVAGLEANACVDYALAYRVL